MATTTAVTASHVIKTVTNTEIETEVGSKINVSVDAIRRYPEDKTDSEPDTDDNAPRRDSEVDTKWELDFGISVPSAGISFTFNVAEPYLCNWDVITSDSDKGYVTLYQGNGEGSIQKKDGNLIFTAAPSGAGGDVTSTVTVRAELVLPLLKKALAGIGAL